MKKFQKIAIFVCAILVLSLSACKQVETQEIKEPEIISETSDISEENILLKVEEANKADALAARHDKVGYTSKLILKDGSEDVLFTYQDKDKFVEFNTIADKNNVFVNRSGEITFYDGSTEKYYSHLFVDDAAYEEYIERNPLAPFVYDPLEEVTSIKENGDLLIIESEITDEELLAESTEETGYESDKILKETYIYEVDAKSYEIYRVTSTYMFKDGSTAKSFYAERVENYENYMPSEDLMLDTSSLEKRTASVIENPGTPDEIKKEYSVPVGMWCNIIVSSEYDQDIYLDPEFTIKASPDADPNAVHMEDFSVYIKKK